MRTIHKYFIESLIINSENDPMQWTSDDWERVTKGHSVIGYLFCTKAVKFGIYGKTLNLYLINKKHHCNSEVNSKDIYFAASEFYNLCMKYPDEKDYTKRMVFKNPPIEEWLATKDNWISKTTKELSESWEMSYDEVLSIVYSTIVEFFHKGTIYMGNLNYIYKGIVNNLRLKERYDKNRLYGDNVISGESARYIDKDGNIESWFDTIGEDDPAHIERDYRDLVDDIKRAMRKDFSEREVEQIFTVSNVGYLPRNLYIRLLKWRSKHNVKEFYDL